MKRTIVRTITSTLVTARVYNETSGQLQDVTLTVEGDLTQWANESVLRAVEGELGQRCVAASIDALDKSKYVVTVEDFIQIAKATQLKHINFNNERSE